MFIIYRHIIENYGVFSWWINYGIICFYLGIIGITLDATRNNRYKKNLTALLLIGRCLWRFCGCGVPTPAMYHPCCCCCPGCSCCYWLCFCRCCRSSRWSFLNLNASCSCGLCCCWRPPWCWRATHLSLLEFSPVLASLLLWLASVDVSVVSCAVSNCQPYCYC
jgi:hypothetical protein